MNENGTNMVMPVGPSGGGFFGGGDGGFFALALLFLLFGGGMWGGYGGMNGGNNMYPWLNQADITTSGFQNAAINSSLAGIQGAVTSGFGDMQTALCGGFAGVNANIANGFAQTEIAANARQIADMQQNFALQSQLANCCCENRLATANLQNVVQAENCADRAALNDALNVVRTDLNSGVQSIKDQMCQDTINRLTTENNQLRDAATRSNIENYVQNALTAQTQYFLSLYTPTRTPAAAPAA